MKEVTWLYIPKASYCALIFLISSTAFPPNRRELSNFVGRKYNNLDALCKTCHAEKVEITYIRSINNVVVIMVARLFHHALLPVASSDVIEVADADSWLSSIAELTA